MCTTDYTLVTLGFPPRRADKTKELQESHKTGLHRDTQWGTGDETQQTLVIKQCAQQGGCSPASLVHTKGLGAGPSASLQEQDKLVPLTITSSDGRAQPSDHVVVHWPGGCGFSL